MPRIKRALISAFDKTGIVELANILHEHHVEIISTGGTAKYLKQRGVEIRPISDITDFPEILDGRVKTLNPRIFGGLLALRENVSHLEEIQKHRIELIDLVVVNLYPFEETIAQEKVSLLEALENIDIGGPSLIRAAAKNYLDVTVVTSPDQYREVISQIRDNNCEVSLQMRKELAGDAFRRISDYDSAISAFLRTDRHLESVFPEEITFQYQKVQDLRYGENPHQRASLYVERKKAKAGLLNAKQLHGKELSFNNMLDLNAALGLVQEFNEPCSVVIKHTNPCGVAVGEHLHAAYLQARATDPVSAFGGIVGLNRQVDVDTARAISEVFTEAIIAPGFTIEALEILQAKKNLRLLESPEVSTPSANEFDIKRVQGGILIQDQDLYRLNDIDLKVMTKRQPTEDEWTALKFGWQVAKWVKSNAIVFVANNRTIGIGAGQMSRVDSSRLAIEKAKLFGLDLQDTAMASDAFFPFRDAVDVAAVAGASAIIQPGGSIRDDEIIAAADEHNLTMVFTGIRHFRH